MVDGINSTKMPVVHLLIPVKYAVVVSSEEDMYADTTDSQHNVTEDSRRDYISVFCKLYTETGDRILSAVPCTTSIASYLLRMPGSLPTQAGRTGDVWLVDE